MLYVLSDTERLLVLKALIGLRVADESLADQISQVMKKIVDTESQPNITVGVHGGQVQWVLGNPFPIRICDYDGDDRDLSDVDERGQRCRMWLEPPSGSTVQG